MRGVQNWKGEKEASVTKKARQLNRMMKSAKRKNSHEVGD